MSVFEMDSLSWDSLSDVQQTAYEWNDLGKPREYSVIADANTLWDAARNQRHGPSDLRRYHKSDTAL